MNEFKKTFLLFCFGFIGSLAVLNSNYLYSQVQGFQVQEKELSNIADLTARTFLFPLSPEANHTKKEVAIVLPKPKPANQTVTVVESAVTSLKTNLEIPILGIRAPVVFEATTNEDRIYKSLEKGVVHYSTTPQLGDPGTAIIIGHSSVYPWYKGKYGSVFAQLSKLKNGDIINVEKDGKILTYRVSRSLIFSPASVNDFELRDLETTNGSSLVLMTCWPTGTNSKRVAVRADLII